MQPKLTFTLLIAVAATLILGSCQRNVTTPTVVGKWTMVTAINTYQQPTGATRSDTTRFTAADYFEFKSDSTITIVETGKTYNGRWRMFNSRVILSGTNYLDTQSGFELPILTATDLQMYYTSSTPLFQEQKLNFTR